MRTNYNITGKQDGLFEWYWLDGKLREKSFYVNGVLNGKQEKYGLEGQIEIVNWIMGKKNGPFLIKPFYDPSLVGTYKNDLL